MRSRSRVGVRRVGWRRVGLHLGATALAGFVLAVSAVSANQDQSAVLRVCADPNNLPQSNERGEGYENKIAEELARDLGRRVEYTFFPQRMGFVRNTLRHRDEATKQYKCDVIIGVPKGYELTATTRPYMQSTYALLVAEDKDLRDLRTPDDLLKLPRDRLSKLRIGVFARSPGADWLLKNGLFDQAEIYAAQSGDPAENPAHIIGQDLEGGKIQAAIVWGPVAGYLAQRHATTPAWKAVPFPPDPQIKFNYEIAMGVRFGEKQWQGELDAWIDAHQGRIDEILSSYRVPLLDANGQLKQARPEEQ